MAHTITLTFLTCSNGSTLAFWAEQFQSSRLFLPLAPSSRSLFCRDTCGEGICMRSVATRKRPGSRECQPWPRKLPHTSVVECWPELPAYARLHRSNRVILKLEWVTS